MGKKRQQFKERRGNSYNRKRPTKELRSGGKEPFIVLSFKDFDRNQGQSFADWEEVRLLSQAISKLHNICALTKNEAIHQQIIKEYQKGEFPHNSDFHHPKHIRNDIAWCTMHIQGKECIIGYFEDNIFYIVFLDKDHRFWITEKKNT